MKITSTEKEMSFPTPWLSPPCLILLLLLKRKFKRISQHLNRKKVLLTFNKRQHSRLLPAGGAIKGAGESISRLNSELGLCCPLLAECSYSDALTIKTKKAWSKTHITRGRSGSFVNKTQTTVLCHGVASSTHINAPLDVSAVSCQPVSWGTEATF